MRNLHTYKDLLDFGHIDTKGIVVIIPACHMGDWGSFPQWGAILKPGWPH